jgi:hypothetical protein
MAKDSPTPGTDTPGGVSLPSSQPRSFDPWRFGKVAIPRGLREELIGTELPIIPSERLYMSPAASVHGNSRLERRASLLAAVVVVLFFGVTALGAALLYRSFAVDDTAVNEGAK